MTYEEKAEYINKWIKRSRKHSQSGFAKRLGLTKAYVSMALNPYRLIDICDDIMNIIKNEESK